MTKVTRLSWLDQLRFKLRHKLQNRLQLLELLHEAKNSEVLDYQALTMMESVLEISEMQARDIMIPRAQTAFIEKNASLEEIIKIMQETAHSRFPVIDEDHNDVEGVVLAKDFLPYAFDRNTKFELRNLLRPAMFIPESKRLNILLKEFRDTKNHMAIVIDEYGGVAGVVTLEDVLEQIVGEIEDEYDVDSENSIKKLNNTTYTIKAVTSMEDFNEHFDKPLDKLGCDTIGGLVTKHLGHLPKRGETIKIEGYTFKVLHADSRNIRTLEMTIN